MPQGKLIICPTPIGNLGDITQRTLDALRGCDVVCAEDTRVTGKLLAAYDIEKRLERLDEAMISDRAERIVARIESGETITYCSDAGMPGVSDPGLRLVSEARKMGVPVEVLPGASAAATAYVASGCTNTRYLFGGFLPRKEGELHALLESIAALDAALVFYESPNRIAAALAALAEAFPYREVSVCRELTKIHEEIYRATVPEAAEEFSRRSEQGTIKGEIVIVVDGPSAREEENARADAEAAARQKAEILHAEGLRNKEIARLIAEEFGIPRNVAYDIALGQASC